MASWIRRDGLLRGLLAALLIGALGCSFSYSSKSSSDSSESSSNSSASSSDSSSPDSAASRRYREDIADYTEAYVISGGSQDDSFLRGVGDIADERGISDWEANPDTWEAIGVGLKRVETNQVKLEVYKSNWSGGDPGKMAGIQKGYESRR